MSIIRSVARTLVPARLRAPIRRWLRSRNATAPVRRTSDGMAPLGPDAHYEDYAGWHQPGVAEWQNSAYHELIERMYAGDVRRDLQVAADAVRATGLDDPTVLEVGCGSGYYYEILTHLLSKPDLKYVGLDYSHAMIELALRCYPTQRFVEGDAAALPFADNEFDVVINGAALMHIAEYRKAIGEAGRVAGKWCIFHTVPMFRRRKTAVLRKNAYGEPVYEITFGAEEFEDILRQEGLQARQVFESIPHEYLSELYGTSVSAFTYVCEVVGGQTLVGQ